MNTQTSPTCPQCGSPLPADAPHGLCPRCLGAMNLGSETFSESGAPTAAAPTMTPEELAPHFPQLEILDCLGRGGMGVVYRARQKSLDRVVALKLLAPERVHDAQFAERFASEAQALARLNHPNIVTVHDFGQAGGFYFLLMEFVDGVNLRQAMRAGRFTPEQALAIVPPICEALQYAHEHGIVHRDIKPENLLLDKEGRVKIADFGIAKMLGEESSTGVAESQPAGTPQYMAPEQKEHQRTDHRADIYSLGVVLYEMLTGELPGAKLQPPSSRGVQIDVRLDEIVLRALEKSPELRYQTAAEMRTQVETIAPNSASLPKPAAAQSNRWIKAGKVCLLLALLIVVGAGLITSLLPRAYYASGYIEVTPADEESAIVFQEAIRATSPDKRSMLVVQQRNTPLFEIGVYSASPKEAADIANHSLLKVQEYLAGRPGVTAKIWEKAEPPANPARPQPGKVMAIATFICLPLLVFPGIVLLAIGLIREHRRGSMTEEAADIAARKSLGWLVLLFACLIVGVIAVSAIAGTFWLYSWTASKNAAVQRSVAQVKEDRAVEALNRIQAHFDATRSISALGTVAASQSADKDVLVSFEIPEDETKTIQARRQAGQLSSVEVDVVDFNKKILAKGVLVSVADKINPTTSGLSCTAKVQPQPAGNNGELLPGHSVFIRVLPGPAPQAHLVPQSAVDTTRTSLQTIEALYKAGNADYVSVLKAKEQLQWAEAMFAGDKLGAAVARRDGAKQRLAIMAKQRDAGMVSAEDMAPTERELAEAEAQVSELQGASQPGAPPSPR